MAIGSRGSEPDRGSPDPGNTDRDDEGRLAVERLLLFTDAVVAIAITLLVLPLVDLAGEDLSLADMWDEHRGQFVAFGLSFLVIAKMWVGHHAVARSIPRCTPVLLWSNILWLATIVFLAFTTELLGGPRGEEASTRVAYVASILACTITGGVLERVIAGLRRSTGDHRLSTVGAWVASGLVVTALVIVAVAPDLGLWPLLLLALSGPITNFVSGRLSAADS